MTSSRLHTAVLALALCCCLVVLHASSAADTPLSPGLRVPQLIGAPASLGANDQPVAGEAEEAGGGRMVLEELEDYPGSGANDRHSPWGMQRRN